MTPRTTPTGSLFSARIVMVAFVYPDGQIDVRDHIIEKPHTVELDGPWVHVVEIDQFGARTPIRSYPAHEVQRVEWREDRR